MSGIFAARRAAAREQQAQTNQADQLAEIRKQQMFDSAFQNNQANNYQQVPNRLSGSSKRQQQTAAPITSGGFFSGGGGSGRRNTFLS